MSAKKTSFVSMTKCIPGFLLAIAGVAGCGDLGRVQDRAPLAVIDGKVHPSNESPSVDSNAKIRIAVVWLTSKDGYRSTNDVPATAIFPSQFRIELKDPPPASAMEHYPLTAPDETESPAAPTEDRDAHDTSGGAVRISSDTPGSGSFAMAVGAVVAYEDKNGNGQLDLVASGESPIDRVLGASEELSLVYIEGDFVSPFNRDVRGAPGKGYNILRASSCIAPRKSEPATPCAEAAWMPTTTLYDLPLAAKPQFADLMCRSTSGSSSSSPTVPTNTKPGQTPPPAPGPKGWPKKDDPELVCDQDGKGYSLIHCETTSTGLCEGSHESCTSESWTLPNANAPAPPEWPCPVN